MSILFRLPRVIPGMTPFGADSQDRTATFFLQPQKGRRQSSPVRSRPQEMQRWVHLFPWAAGVWGPHSLGLRTRATMGSDWTGRFTFLARRTGLDHEKKFFQGRVRLDAPRACQLGRFQNRVVTQSSRPLRCHVMLTPTATAGSRCVQTHPTSKFFPRGLDRTVSFFHRSGLKPPLFFCSSAGSHGKD
ncbi:hypothetical protein Enr8_41750 [Blastopirellula retiformator]|uniref:Uncharacterized protein n=1 Tax=Blastopirellula retiformator TaxID=2527970 RepID=A0A5C5UW99_9BACT|nr:hypothetical protein Enr8_41750 [Blastopirellula retiformator]